MKGDPTGLVTPHGRSKRLEPRLLSGEGAADARRRTERLPRIMMTSRETSDLIMLGIGAYTPLDGFMGYQDWKHVCDELRLADGVFWPIPITLSTTREQAAGLTVGQDVALVDAEAGELMGSLTIREVYRA